MNSKNLISNSIKGNIIESKEINVLSDINLKKNIIYNNVSPIYLDNINTATFEYLNDDISHIGFIAQDIQEYYPQLINTDSNGILSIKYLEIIPLLLDYNKDLKTKLNNLEDKINNIL